MKILVFLPSESDSESGSQVWLYADSSLMGTNRALFLPDISCAFHSCAALVARIGRLGKSIMPQYAPRYCDAFTAGFVTMPAEGVANPLLRCFDGAVACGQWVSANGTTMPTLGAHCGNTVSATHGNTTWHTVAQAVTAASQQMTLKTGDLLCLAGNERFHVHAGDVLHGLIDGTEVLTVRVK